LFSSTLKNIVCFLELLFLLWRDLNAVYKIEVKPKFKLEGKSSAVAKTLMPLKQI
jgi:hypothetical protein